MKRIGILLLAGVALPLQAGVTGDLRKAGKLYQKEKYGAALSRYQSVLQKNPDNASAHFGAGASAYYLKQYQQAAQDFENAAGQSEKLRQDSLFNLGNTHYRAGQKQAAMAAYKQAILLNKHDKQAIHNLQLLLQEQQQQQNQNNQNDANQRQDSKNQGQQDQQDKPGQAPQQQQPQPQPAQPQQDSLEKQAADRVMQLARDNEYKRPTQPGANAPDESVEKDW